MLFEYYFSKMRALFRPSAFAVLCGASLMTQNGVGAAFVVPSSLEICQQRGDFRRLYDVY